MTDSDFFTQFSQKPIPIRQFQGKSPMFFQNLHMMGAIFLVDLDRLYSLLPNSKYHPLALPGRKGLAAVHCMEYRSSDIGPYNEVSLSIAIQYGKHSRLQLLNVLEAALLHHYSTYVVELPVTTEIALFGGLDYFNFPKYLAHIDFEETATQRICRINDVTTGAPIIEVSINKLKLRKFSQKMSLTTYPVKDGKTIRAELSLKPLQLGTSFLSQSAQVRTFDHERAKAFSSLKLGRPLQTFYAPHCQAILFEPKEITKELKRSHAS